MRGLLADGPRAEPHTEVTGQMNRLTYLGLDVHKETIAVAALGCDEAAPSFRVVDNTPEALRKATSRLGPASSVRACYEAGCTGYDTHRLLESWGIVCDVIAPSLIPRRPGDRVKTDRIDARNLALLHRAGQLSAIRVPSPQEEAIRDLVRVREDIKDDRRRAQQRTKSFLLRQGRRYPGNSTGWTAKFDAWVRSQRFTNPAAQLAFDHYLAARMARASQLDAIDRQIAVAADQPSLADSVARLRCLRGIDTLSAVTIATEVCDFRRFASAASFMAFTGLVPSEHSSGSKDRRGSITKSGNRHVRRVLVEAAWSCRHRPYVGRPLAARQQGQSPEVLAYCLKAQHRLHQQFWLIETRRNKNVAAVAVARELAGFIWGLMMGRTS